MRIYLVIFIFITICSSCQEKQTVKTISFKLDVSQITDKIENPSTIGISGSLTPLTWDSILYLKKTENNIFSTELSFDLNKPDTLFYRYVHSEIEWENWEMGGGADRMMIINANTNTVQNDLWGEVTVKTGSALPSPLLLVLQSDSEAEKRSLSKPYSGITNDGNLRQGLFQLKKTDVSTENILSAVTDFLNSLSDEQKRACTFPIDDNEWRRWSNIDMEYYKRKGIGLEDLNTEQKELAVSILKESLSTKGFQKVSDIMKMEAYLGYLAEKPEFIGEDKYWFTFMGIPSSTEPWGWQIDGHHLVINTFVLGDQMVMTPTFMGSEPTFIAEGENKGIKTFKDEELLGLSFYQSLSSEQKQKATLWNQKKYAHNQAESYSDNRIIPYSGINWTQFTDEQKAMLTSLIHEYIGNIHEGHSEIKMQEIKNHYEETYFAWVGPDNDFSVFYYRIHSPVVLIEFDHQTPIFVGGTKPSRKHIHTVVRTPNGNDYGKDLLRQHKEKHH